VVTLEKRTKTAIGPQSGDGRKRMLRASIGGVALAAFLAAACGGAFAHDASKFPDWSGQWTRTYTGNPRYDQTKPIRKQEAPLKPEYQAQFEASIRDQDLGGHGLDPAYSCLPQGMPRMMSGVSPFEFLISPDVTHVLFERTEFSPRRIYTDGRQWPQTEETWFPGYSVGKWRDTDGDGRFDTLEVETRHVRGPRVWDQSGMPMADDDEGVITERIFSDKTDPDLLRVEMTTVDNSLTRPWTVTKTFKRRTKVWWANDNCIEGQAHVTIGKEVYFRSAEGMLMPMKKDQPPPDLRYFKREQK
jgi:hypothetical protein